MPTEINTSHDENEVTLDDTPPELDIEVVDDTPPEDRGRTPLPKEMVEELEKDDLEEYSDKVKKRLSQMKKVWHDERRAKEASLREKEEAIRFAQVQAEENRRLKERLGQVGTRVVQEAHRATKGELDTAKSKFKAAYEAGDVETLTAAQEEIANLTMRMREIERAQPARQTPENTVQNTQQPQQPERQPTQMDPKLRTWREKNTWFDSPGNEDATGFAYGLHEKLVRSGVDPNSDTYYREIDKTMRKRFPDLFEGEDSQSSESSPPQPQRTKAASVVAPATRSTAPKRVTLTPTQVAIAKRLGLSNDAYAREVIKLENNNG